MIEHQLEMIDRRFRIYNREQESDPGTTTIM